MQEENMNVSQAALKRQTDNMHNANNVRAAAEMASKTANPYAKAVGAGIKIADKFTDGKASEKIGKAVTTLNKLNGLKGKMMQSALNKMSKSGTSNRIASAMAARNGGVAGSSLQHNTLQQNQSNAVANPDLRERVEEDSTDGGMGTVKISMKVVKALIAIAPFACLILVFCTVFISASQAYLSVIGLGSADKVSEEKAGEKIQKAKEDKLNQEVKDENASIYISDSIIRNKKLYNYSIVQIAKKSSKAKYNEAQIELFSDYFPYVEEEGRDYDEHMVYDFYYKMYNLYTTYKSDYKVELDFPLIMSTLGMQSPDKNIIFESNLDVLDRGITPRPLPVAELDFYYNWEEDGYVSTKTKSTHDMEILAQQMVSNRVKEMCLNKEGNVVKSQITIDLFKGQILECAENQIYKKEIIDHFINKDKYRDFLNVFLERKYFTDRGFKPIVYNGSRITDVYPKYKDGNYVEEVTFSDSSFESTYYFNQYDYENYYYSSDVKTPQYKRSSGDWATIASHGCGPTSLSIVLSSILNRSIDPIETTQEVCKNNGCTTSGTVHTVLSNVARNYGVTVTETNDNQSVIDALSSNNSLVIVLMGPGTFTSGGHYIVLTGANSQGQVSVADPASRQRTQTKWFSFNNIVEQRKTYASYIIFSR